MARHSNGWVKIYRAAILGDIGSNFNRLGIFTALISIANLKRSVVNWDGKPRKLERGELVTSLRELADLGEVDVKTVSRHLQYLQLRETISVEKSTSGTFIKINNFEQYQSQDAEGSTQAPHGMDDGLHTTGIHIEELKNKRIKEDAANPKTPRRKIKTPEELLEEVGQDNIKALLRIYPQELIDQEFPRMAFWLSNNPPKTNYAKFVGNWLAKAMPAFNEALNARNAKANLMEIIR